MKIKENGRSMVEMLGVLAIIGVLSAGAMAGYSKAMFRHRVNQTIDIFQGVLQRFSELEQRKGWAEKNVYIGNSGNGSAEDMIAYGIFPNCQKIYDENDMSMCKLPIGGLQMEFREHDAWVQGDFIIYFNDVNSCIAFASAHWENVAPIEWWNPSGFIIIGNKNIYWPGINKTQVSMSDVVEGCQSGHWMEFAIHAEE